MRRDPTEFIETFASLWRCLMALSDETYAAERLWSTQARFLRHIDSHPGISQATLARATDTAPTLTGRLLQTLLDRGLVLRRRSRDDRREYVLELSADGQRARRRVVRARARFAARVVAELDERDLHDFDRIARKIFAAFGGLAAARDGARPDTNPMHPRSPDDGQENRNQRIRPHRPLHRTRAVRT